MQVSPARGWHSHWVCFMLGEIPHWCCAQRDWLLSLRDFQSCLSTLTDSFLFRERLRSSRPPLFYLPETCEEKAAGQKIWAASYKRAHAGSMPRASPSTQREHSAVLFIQHNQRPSMAASDLISFGVSDNKLGDSLSLAASDAEELSGSVIDPTLLPSSASRNARLRADKELIRIMTKAVNKLGLEWSPPEEPSRSRLDECFLPGRHQALRQRSSPFFPEVHDELTKSWCAPYSSRIRPSALVALTSVDRAEEKGYEHLPPLNKSMAAHLCHSSATAIGWKARASHPSKPCRATSALAGHVYSAAGQAASALHTMAVLQVFQAKMLANEVAGLDSASLKDLRSMTDLALRATKATAQAIRRSMSSLIVLERHIWLTMTEMEEADKVPFLDSPVSSGSLFEPAVEGFAERFTEAQKSPQAMRHFLPKCTSSSSASSRPRPAPSQQTAKPTPTAPEPWPPEGRRERGRSRSARRYPFPKHQGPRPKIALDPAPQKSSWTARQKEEGPSLATAGQPRKQPVSCLSPPRLALGAE